MAGDPAADRQALAAVPQAARPPAASRSTSPGCWRAPDPSMNATGSPTAARCTPGTCSPPHRRPTCTLLASVLHDWDDDHTARILTALGHSATSDTRLRIFEMLLPIDTTPHRAKLSDVLMLLLFDGPRERALGQYRDLLEGTGWRLERVLASPGPMSVIQASRSAPG
jgi:O-methyltransferase domain